MRKKVVISKTAERKLQKLFDYLIAEWSAKVKSDFVEKLDSSIEVIRNQPEIQKSEKLKEMCHNKANNIILSL